MSEVAIEIEEVRYVYPDGFVALDDVNLKILRDERVAILGPNGAGKSTLLMLMNGLFTPSRGRVSVLGMPVSTNSRKVRMNVGLVFQDPDDQLFCPTLWEDVSFGPLNMGLPDEEVLKRTRDALEAVGLEGYEQKPPHHLSVGEKKKAAIATVLAMQPEILILDEPTANLDSKSRLDLVGVINSLRRNRDMTLITATHDVNFLPEVADRVYVLSKGHIISEGPLREVFSNPKIMNQVNLEPPIITRLFHLLAERSSLVAESTPLTFEEALYEIDRLVKGDKSNSSKDS
jgi:cobalt/nickel transport system ATP-binding protein